MRIKHVLMMVGLAIAITIAAGVASTDGGTVEAATKRCSDMGGCAGGASCTSPHVFLNHSQCQITCYESGQEEETIVNPASIQCSRGAGGGGRGSLADFYGCAEWYCDFYNFNGYI